jgi:hypothetical protein
MCCIILVLHSVKQGLITLNNIQASNRALARRRSLLGLEASFGFLTVWRAIHQHMLRQLSWQPTGVLS